MTSLSRETVTTTTHRILVPTRATISEMELALAWARTTAEEFDKDTSYDDWAHVVVEDDDIVIEIVTDEGSETTTQSETTTEEVTK